MKIAHLSDTHLGFRAYSRTHASGVNQRSIDVVNSFRGVLASILEFAPDIVVHAGDFFHVVKPDNDAIFQGVKAVKEFQEARGGLPFILCGGNHDSPKAVGGNIQRLFTLIPGVRFAANLAEVIDLPEFDTEVLCVPSNSLVVREEVAMRPTLGRTYSILTMHGMSAQALPKAADSHHADFDVNDIPAQLFTYTALGDYHVHAPYAANCCFSGSTDYTTTDIWEEVGTPKGWVQFDTDLGYLRHVTVATRAVVDLAPIDAEGVSIEDIQARMLAQFDADVPTDGLPIVRQRITNLHPTDRRRVFAGSCVRDLMARSLNYQVKTDGPTADRGKADPTKETPTEGVISAGSIEALWVEQAQAAKLPADVDRDAFIMSGLELLREAAQTATAVAA